MPVRPFRSNVDTIVVKTMLSAHHCHLPIVVFQVIDVVAKVKGEQFKKNHSTLTTVTGGTVVMIINMMVNITNDFCVCGQAGPICISIQRRSS
jgi:hypothetical protein